MKKVILTGPKTQVRFAGVVSVEVNEDTGVVRPWRIDHQQQHFFDFGLLFMAAHCSGCRIRLKTTSDQVHLVVKNLSNTSACEYDCYANKQFIGTCVFAGKNVIDASNIPFNGKEMEMRRMRILDLTIEDKIDDDFHTVKFNVSHIATEPNEFRNIDIWLPHTSSVQIKDVLIQPNSKVERPLRDLRGKFLTHGSSITHGIAADATTTAKGRGSARSPSKSWPATCSRICDFNLINLGFGGQCHMDNSVARMIRDLPADFICLKLGINVHNLASLGVRGFSQAVMGFLRTIRDGHPDTPIVVVSPIYSTWRETLSANVLTLSMTPERDTKLKHILSLEQMRRHLQRVVDILRNNGDLNLYYRTGLDLFNADDFHAGLMPDGLHPNAAGYEMIGRRFAALEFGT